MNDTELMYINKQEEIKVAICNAKHNAIQHLIDMVDKELHAMEEQFHALPNPTDNQTIAYYSAKTQLFKFKGALQEQQHAAYVQYNLDKGEKE